MPISRTKVFFSLFLWLILMLMILSFYLWNWLQSDHFIPETKRHFAVSSGESMQSVASKLHHQGLIRWPSFWRYYGFYIEKKSIKAGEFKFDERESPLSILQKLHSYDVILHQITFAEGLSYREMYGRILSEPKLKHLLKDQPLSEHNKHLEFDKTALEGWFFPDTYHFARGDSDIDLLNRAHRKMKRELKDLWSERSKELPYNSSYEALIMASIVEKETGAAFERQKIAGVFVRRLNKKMRLQTDPTVIYGMGEAYQGNLRRKDLRTPTPYNTYVIKGLPPTPIAMPGRDAIYAALHPEAGSSLFFVAKGDGTHVFSDTLQAHEAAVKAYQLTRRKDYRSSPKP